MEAIALLLAFLVIGGTGFIIMEKLDAFLEGIQNQREYTPDSGEENIQAVYENPEADFGYLPENSDREESCQSPKHPQQEISAKEPEKGRGHLKIFFGYASGVGKTYAMLQAAHADIIPTDVANKFIKLVNEGDSQISQVTDKDTNRDMSYEYEMQFKMGIAVILNTVFGVWEII